MSKFSRLYTLVINAIPSDNEEALAALEDLLTQVKQEGYNDGYDAGLDGAEYDEGPDPMDFDPNA